LCGSGAGVRVQYLRLPLRDSESQPLLPSLRAAVRFIATALSAGKPVLVHCSAGVSRSVAVVVGYLMVTRRLRFDAALAALAAEYSVHGQRPAPNDGFVQQLREFEAEAAEYAAAASASAARDRSAPAPTSPRHGAASTESGAP
jgi:protein-tyrosine phosphatase